MSGEDAVRWIGRLDEAPAYLKPAYPGECRDPDDKAGRTDDVATVDHRPHSPCDLGPGVCRDERDEANPACLFPIAWVAPHAEAAHWPLPPPEPGDLADAALAKRDGGAGRLLRRRLLRALVGRVFGLHPSAVRFARDARGAPGLAGLPAFVSTAGCTANGEGWSAVALSPYPVGVDLEAGAASEALARWTLTESYLKALGQGLLVAPEQVRLTPADRGGAGWRLALDGAMSAEGWVRSFPSVTAGVVLLDAN